MRKIFSWIIFIVGLTVGILLDNHMISKLVSVIVMASMIVVYIIWGYLSKKSNANPRYYMDGND